MHLRAHTHWEYSTETKHVSFYFGAGYHDMDIGEHAIWIALGLFTITLYIPQEINR